MATEHPGSPGPGSHIFGDSAMAARIRAHDWSNTPLGPLDQWPALLKSTVNTLLASKFPQCLFWGADLLHIYNDGYRRLLGGKPDALGRPMREIWAESWHLLQPMTERIFQGESVFIEDYPLQVQRGTDGMEQAYFTFCYSPVHNEAGGIDGLLDIVVETTRKVIEHRNRQTKLTALAEATSDAIYSMNADWSELRQLSSSRFLNPTTQANPDWLIEYVYAEDRDAVWREVQAALRDQRVFEFSHRVVRADGSLGWTRSRAVPLFDEHGQVQEWFGAAQDITSEKEADENQRQSQKIEAVGQLTSGVAHDFNNLLMVITGGLNLLPRVTDDARRQKILDNMHDAADRGASLTRQMLSFSRRRELRPSPTDIARTMDGMSELLGRALRGDIRIESDFPPDLWPVHVDSSEFELVLINLCVNARDAMPNGGIITIEACNSGEDMVEVSVSDTGTGMSDAVRARVFEPFFTTKDIGAGSGLGLAQAYGFATQSGGHIHIESQPDVGTRVAMRLPRSTETPARATPKAAPPGENAASRGTVLVVEDDKNVATFVSEMLETLGFDALCVESPAAALGALANDRPLTLLFSDIMMPGGLNGVDLAMEVRKRRPALPILLTTGYPEGFQPQADAARIALLPKPYDLNTLDKKVRDVIDNVPRWTFNPKADAAL
ncbi:PAS domain-containing sensor histidine kinase [Asticcacaulis sp. AND118]|uniref:hybrid sensor histidine kinase/response regulator n=1 Tax=Asticcacaulis sp. AND118 TaxID=2840468 RepID=UPI001CFF6F0A|nr:PAS domain-containing sensor histidine kinase [Asticcacaulis sp. AND118]UDF02593.1 PAS domain-containing protein [Asticcacaulis sp. AND118]